VSRNFRIKNSSDRTEICKISYNFLTVATIWDVMLTKRIGFLSFLPLVVSHYSVFPLEVTTTQKCHRSVRCLLKNTIVPLDVSSKMPLDIIIFTSNSLTMLYDKNKPRPTCQFSLSHNDKCGPLVRSNQANNFIEK